MTHNTPSTITTSCPRWPIERSLATPTVRAILHYAADVCRCADTATTELFTLICVELDHADGRPTRSLFAVLRQLNQHLDAAHD